MLSGQSKETKKVEVAVEKKKQAKKSETWYRAVIRIQIQPDLLRTPQKEACGGTEISIL